MTTFLPDAINGLMRELKSYFTNIKGNAILDTEMGEDFTTDFPLCICELSDAPESARLPGNGVTRLDWNFSLRVHAFEPGAYNADDGGYSASLMQIVDNLRVYFEMENWATDEMKALVTNYGFRVTSDGISKAENLSVNEGISMGYRLNFVSIAIESATNQTNDYPATNQTQTGTVVFN